MVDGEKWPKDSAYLPHIDYTHTRHIDLNTNMQVTSG